MYALNYNSTVTMEVVFTKCYDSFMSNGLQILPQPDASIHVTLSVVVLQHWPSCSCAKTKYMPTSYLRALMFACIYYVETLFHT